MPYFCWLAIATAAIAIFTLLPLSRHPAWWIRGLDFPRLQLAIVTAGLFALQCALLDFSLLTSQMLLCLTIGLMVYQGWWIAPYTRLFPVEVKPSTTGDVSTKVRLVTANVLTPNRNADALLDIVREADPDILLTLESDTWWEEALKPLEEAYPYTVSEPLDNLYGMHLYSRYPLQDTEVHHLIEDDVPSIHTYIGLPNGMRVQAHFLHPAPPSPTENEESTERDVELIVVAKRIQDTRHPVIVAGDLNDVAWSDTTRLFRRISGLVDPRVGRGFFATFHAKIPLLRWPLDHVFHSDDFKLGEIRRLSGFGSDHFPILIELYHEPAASDDGSDLELREQDEQWAEEKLMHTERDGSAIL